MSFGYQILGFGAFPNRATGYQVTRALIFDGSADELTFTPSQDGTGAGKKYTLSFWTKIIDPDSTGSFFSAGQAGGDSLHIQTDWSSGNPFLNFNDSSGGSSNWLRRTGTRVLRDPTAWMHILFAVDNSSGGGLAGTAAAARVYINGVEDTTFATASTHPASSETSRMTMQYEHVIGNGAGFSDYKAFYLAEFIIVDGQQLAPTDLGEFTSNGIWIPKNPAGLTFGNNGCHLDFKSANIGNDVSGNNNNFTATGMGVNNVVSDTCTDGVEEEVTFFSCLDEDNKESSLVLSSNNLKAENDSASNWQSVLGNIGLTSGRFYYEITRVFSGHGYEHWGVAGDGKVASDLNRGSAGTILFDTNGSGIRFYNESETPDGTLYYGSATGSTSGDVIGVDLDVDNDTIELIIGGTGRGTKSTSGLAKPLFPVTMITSGGSVDHVYNFGASSYTHTKPTGASDITKTTTGVGNHATWNPVAKLATTLSEGNTKYTRSGYPSSVMCTHFAHTSGKYFCEARFTRADTVFLGVKPINAQTLGNGSVSSPWNEQQNLYFAYLSCDALGGNIISPETASAIADQGGGSSRYSVASGDTVGCLLNLDDYNVRWYKLTNGAWVQIGNNAANATVPLYPTGQSWTFVARGTSAGDAIDANFGQRPFSATPPDSAVPLSTHNIAEPTITAPQSFFRTLLYTGNNANGEGSGDEQEINMTDNTTGNSFSFQPDFVWVKNRSVSSSHQELFDVVRGSTTRIRSTSAGSENTNAQYIKSFDDNGFTVGDKNDVNYNGSSYAAWCWKAGGAGSANSDGNVTGGSTVSVASHNGFAIVKYGDCGGAAKTIGHGMGQAPDMIMVKAISGGSASSRNWRVYHKDLTSDYVLYLDLTDGQASEAASFGTIGTSTFGVDGGNGTSANGESHIAYCFARTPGLVGIGSYVGNGSSDGAYIVVDDSASGFKPAFILGKQYNADGQNWWIVDNAREPFNSSSGNMSFPNSLAAEADNSGNAIDFTANGFKPRSADTHLNASNSTYIYLAFAESPFPLQNRAK